MNPLKNIATAFALLFLVSLSFNKSFASHAISGAIEYTHISGDDYLVTIDFYRDCTGIAAPATLNLLVNSTSCSINQTITLPVTSTTDVTPDCPTNVSACVLGGGAFGVELHKFSDTITMPIGCPDIILSFNISARNPANNIGGGNLYVETKVNTLIAPYNNSPSFNVDPIFIIFNGQLNNFSMGTSEMDGDMVRYSLTNPLVGSGTSVNFVPPHTFSNPIVGAPPLSINPLNGNMSINPSNYGGYTYAILVEEFRSGVLIGSMIRDMQVEVIPDTTAGVPSVSGFGGVGSTNYNATICLTDTINFPIFATDPNLGDTITLRTVPSGFGSPVTTSSNVNSISTNFYWSPVFAGITTPGLYSFTLEVKDNACPYSGLATYTYNVLVQNCATLDSVWPGDANSDLVANAFDLLNVGLAYGESWLPRSSISNAWVGHFSNNWIPLFSGGVNYKHADCDGSGIVDSLDALAISLNYGLTHPKTSAGFRGPNDPNLTLEFANDTVFESGTATAIINLGDIGIPVNSIYGIAFKLNYNPRFVKDIVNVDYSGSWLGNANELITIDKAFLNDGTIDIGLSRKNHLNTQGFGEILTIDFVIADEIETAAIKDIFQTMTVNVSDILAVEANENVLAINSSTNNVTLKNIRSIVNDELEIIAYPNPANNVLQFDFGNAIVNKVELLDVDGKVALTSIGHATSIDIESIANGVYVVKIYTTSDIINKKILVSH